MDILQVQGVIESFKTLADGGLQLKVGTPDLTPEDAAILLSLKGREGYFVFKPSRLIEQDILTLPEEPVEKFIKKKSPSQRLYNIIFLIWKNNGSKGLFEDYYKQKCIRRSSFEWRCFSRSWKNSRNRGRSNFLQPAQHWLANWTPHHNGCRCFEKVSHHLGKTSCLWA